MPYTVSFDKEGFVFVAVSSPCTKDDHYAAMDQALTLCEQHKCSVMLIDLRKLNTEAFSTTGCFRFGQTLVKRTKQLKIAHILPTDAMSRGDVRFTSTVEANRGETTGEFKTVEEAKEWLLYTQEG